MISPKLQAKFEISRMVWFPIWQKASSKKKKEIAKMIGEMEAKLIIKEIEQQHGNIHK